MKALKVMQVSFDMPIDPTEVLSFRGAIAHKVGLEHEWFHNHNNADNTNNSYHHRYSLIQYKYRGGHPMILFLDECTEEAHRLFSQENWVINYRGEEVKLKVKDLEIKSYDVGVSPQRIRYSLRNWLPFSIKEAADFKKTERLIDRVEILERKLNSHIVTFAKELNCAWKGHIEAYITSVSQVQDIQLKSTRMLSFSLEFAVNFLLPDFIGLGKSVSLGCGVVRKLR